MSNFIRENILEKFHFHVPLIDIKNFMSLSVNIDIKICISIY